MPYDFDRIIDRRHTNAIATDGFRQFLFDGDGELELPCADDELISMWVADMAFASAPPAIDAMRERLDRSIFGYTALIDDGLADAFASWCERRYSWAPEREHLVSSSGVVPALYDLVEYVLGEGEKVATLTPAYGFFEYAAQHHGRTLVTCGLVETAEHGYEIDFDDLGRTLADPSVRLFFLCHPHNPTGRIWTDDELRRVAELCFDHDVLVVSDEIHCDLLRTGRTHTPLAKLFPDSDRIVTCMSSSKTFNLAGLGIAQVVIPNDDLRKTWIERSIPVVNPLSIAAATGVFTKGDEWLSELRHYLDANLELTASVLADRLPETRFRIPDATYLAWIDTRPYLPPGIDLTRFFAEQAGVLLEGGEKFVADAEGYVRINVACPRAVLETALDRIVAAIPAE